MTKQELQKQIHDKVYEIIRTSFSDKNIKKVIEDQKLVSGGLPINERVLAVLLQSANIKIGNLLEETINIIMSASPYKIVTKIDDREHEGKNKWILKISKENDRLLSEYFNECTALNSLKNKTQKEKDEFQKKLVLKYETLMSKITENIEKEANSKNVEFNTYANDLDLFFYNEKTKKYYYFELKKKDNHDSGKNKDIYKKLIKTYVCLKHSKKLNNVTVDPNDIVVGAIFFDGLKQNNNIFPKKHIYDGNKFFKEFCNISWNDFKNLFSQVEQSQEVIKLIKEGKDRVLAILKTTNPEFMKTYEKTLKVIEQESKRQDHSENSLLKK